MRINPSLQLFLGALFLGCCPALLHAEPPEQIPHEAASTGFLLVASQQMPDPRFSRTVLVVTKHGSTGGSIGIIINRPQDITLDKIFPAYPGAGKLKLFYGGPVFPTQISYLVRGGGAVKGALTISNDVYLAFDRTALDELLSGKRRYKDLRLMYGVASWAPGQLEYEINLGSWYVMPLDEAVIFDSPPAEIWQELYNRANSIIL
jgi:putative transcriptional regulator